MKRFENQCALVTGAAGGIGRAIVDQLRAGGATVAGSDRDGTGLDADVCLPGDLTDKHYCDSLCQRAHDAMGQLDILINNAGVISRGPVTTATDDDLQLSLAVNVEAPFRLCRAAIPLMINGGAIVNTASCWGVRPGPDHALYCMLSLIHI